MASTCNDTSKLIKMINDIHDVCSQFQDLQMSLHLPMIAVVGSQSAGKSSVLESIVGRDFLPRGAGIVTRRPLILQLITSDEEYGTFEHRGDEQFVNFNDICEEIQRETDRLTGTTKNISRVPINLKIYSPNVLNFTMVDLPGLTKVPVGGQPKDIDTQIRTIVEEFISHPNCLILAVSPATSDLANSDALRMAQDVDPSGSRTIGVITKLDAMEPGTNARDVLENKLFFLKRGYIGVVNRNQQDIDSRKPIEAALEQERNFFQNHPSYRDIAHRLGTPFLQLTLHRMLAEHIAHHLPALHNLLEMQVNKLQRDFDELDKTDFTDPSKRNKVIVRLLGEAGRIMKRDLEGQSRTVASDKLSIGAAIQDIFLKDFPILLRKQMTPETKLNEKIATVVRNTAAIRVGFNTPDSAFQQVSGEEIDLIRMPCHYCVDLVAKQLEYVLKYVTDSMNDYPSFRNNVDRLLGAKLQRCIHECIGHLDFFLDCHKDYFFTYDKQIFQLWKGDKEIPPEPPVPATNPSRDAEPASNSESIEIYAIVTKVYFSSNTAQSFYLSLDKTNFNAYADQSKQELKLQIPTAHLILTERNKMLRVARKAGPLRKEVKLDILERVTEWTNAFRKLGFLPRGSMESLVDVPGILVAKEQLVARVEPNLQRVDLESFDNLEMNKNRSIVKKYVSIMHGIIMDTIPKFIVKSLIHSMIDYVPEGLETDMIDEGSRDELFIEPDEIKERRQEVYNSLQSAKAALQIIMNASRHRP